MKRRTILHGMLAAGATLALGACATGTTALGPGTGGNGPGTGGNGSSSGDANQLGEVLNYVTTDPPEK